MILVDASAPPWAHQLAQDISRELARLAPGKRPVRLPAYEKADMPDPARWARCLIVVTDETGGEVVAESDGTNWRRQTDRAVVS